MSAAGWLYLLLVEIQGFSILNFPKSVSYLVQKPLKNNPFKRPQSVLIKQRLKQPGYDTVDEGMQLRATLVSEHYPVANINGKVMTTGDEINGYVLKNVFENRVVLTRDGKDIELRLSQ